MKVRANNELSDAIENLYRTFKRYRPSTKFESCSHCVSEPEDAELKAKTLSDLTCDDISRYAFKAMTTWGTVEDFKHFLPRIFELIATSNTFPIEIEVAIGKLTDGEWHTWPEAERRTLESFLGAWWQASLSQPLSESTQCLADEVLCSVARVVESLKLFLAQWDSRSNFESGLHLAAFVDWNFDSLYKDDRIANPFWERESTMREAVEWLGRPAICERLEKLFLENPEHSHAYLLSEAAQKLDWWTSKPR